MKKEYMNPEMEIVELNMHQMLLAGSMEKYDDDPVDDGDFLAPGMNFGTEFDFLYKE